MTFFTDISKAITSEGKRIHVEVSGVTGGQIRVVITPELGAVPEKASPEVVRVYGLMARPMIVTGEPAEVEAALATKMQGMRHVIDAGEDTLLALAEIAKTATEKAASVKAPAATQAKDSSADDMTASEDAAQDDDTQAEATDIAKEF